MPTTRRGSALLAVCLILAMLFSSPAVPARAEVEAPRFLYVLAPPYGIFFDLKLMIVDTEGGGVDFSDLVVEPEEAPTSGHLLDLGNGVIFFDPDDDAVDGPGELVKFVVCSGESWCTTVRVLLLPVPVKRVVVPYGTTATVDVRTDLANGVNAEDPVHATGLTVSVIEFTGFSGPSRGSGTSCSSTPAIRSRSPSWTLPCSTCAVTWSSPASWTRSCSRARSRSTPSPI